MPAVVVGRVLWPKLTIKINTMTMADALCFFAQSIFPVLNPPTYTAQNTDLMVTVSYFAPFISTVTSRTIIFFAAPELIGGCALYIVHALEFSH